MKRRGLSPHELAEIRPGIVYVTMNCYGDVGPWRQRPGWEQLVQSVSGIAEGRAVTGRPPSSLPAACDYTTGYLAALGTIVALWRRSHEGGSYHVRALALSDRRLVCGRAAGHREAASGFGDVEPFLVTTETAFGALRHLAPVTQIEPAAQPRWALPTTPLGSHAAEWIAANPEAVAGKKR